MNIFANKKFILGLLMTFLISCILIVPSNCYANACPKVTIGKEISETSLDMEYQYYTLTLKSKMKIKITATVDAVEEQIIEGTDEYEDYYYDDFDEETNSINFSLVGEYYESEIDDWEINAGQTKSKTVVLPAGTYTISIYGQASGLEYTFITEDKSIYTKKITIANKLSLLVGDSKKVKVKSEESGKLMGEVIWTSSNKKIATVDSSGNVKGKKKGTCVISAKTKNSKTVKCKVIIRARPQLYITEASFIINYIGGVEPFITLQNNFGKTIKYIYFNTYYYNTVGDPAYCVIQNTHYQRLRVTGPIKNGEYNLYSWNAVIYNNSTGKMYIKSAEIVFMNGSKKTISIKKSYK